MDDSVVNHAVVSQVAYFRITLSLPGIELLTVRATKRRNQRHLSTRVKDFPTLVSIKQINSIKMFSLHYLNLDFKVLFFILNDKKIETIFIHSACYSTTQWRTKIAKELIKVEKN